MRKGKYFVLVVGMLLLFSMVFAGCGGSDNEGSESDTAVMCQNGNMVGTVKNDVHSYKGVPYAKPPVGELRWKAPEAPDASDEDVDASDYGYSAIQTEWFSEAASQREKSEDCLTLNIWTKSPNTEDKKPVMVFFHGGGFGWGGSGDPLYDGQNFVEEHDDVILITANYRLGIMGAIDFSSVEGGEDFKEAPNLMLLDYVQALKWVQENVSQFGGDPDNVTIIGESAGSANVAFLMIMEQAEGLFNRCISESGSANLTSSKEECQELVETILDVAKVSTVDELMALSEEEIIKINETEIDEDGTTVNDLCNKPQRDGYILPDTVEGVYEAFGNESSKNIDYLVGTNKNEWNYWIGEMAVGDEEENYEVYKGWMEARFERDTDKMTPEDKAVAEEFIAKQTDKEEPWKTTEFYNDMAFRVPSTTIAKNHFDAGGNTYMYYWEYPSSIKRYGACHAVELAYVFNNLQETVFTGENPSEELAKQTQEAWVNFAKTGNPSRESIEWPQYGEDRTTMIINEEWKIEKDPLSEQRVMIEKLINYGIK